MTADRPSVVASRRRWPTETAVTVDAQSSTFLNSSFCTGKGLELKSASHQDSKSSTVAPASSDGGSVMHHDETPTIFLDFSTASPSFKKKGVVRAFHSIVSPLANPEFAPRVPRRIPSSDSSNLFLSQTAHGRLERTTKRNGRPKIDAGALPAELALESLSGDSPSRRGSGAPRRPVRKATNESELEQVAHAATRMAQLKQTQSC